MFDPSLRRGHKLQTHATLPLSSAVQGDIVGISFVVNSAYHLTAGEIASDLLARSYQVSWIPRDPNPLRPTHLKGIRLLDAAGLAHVARGQKSPLRAQESPEDDTWFL